MTSILALAALGSWTYAGFLAEPTPAPPAPPPASAPSRPIEPEKILEPAPKPGPQDPFEPEEEPEEEPEKQPEAPPASTATSPTRYRLADASGQVWEHSDPVNLQSFVEARNRSFVQQRYYQPLRARSAPCLSGRCK